MRLPAGLSEDDVRRFATRKRVAPDASSSCMVKKSRTTDPSVVLDSINALPTAPVIALCAPATAAAFEDPPVVTRSKEDAIIFDVPIVVLVSRAQLAVVVPAS